MRADSTTPAAGIVVSAIMSNGKTVASALSSQSGNYSLRLPAAGRYQLRALHIGFRPTVLGDIDVSVGNLVQDIVLRELPISIAAVVVRDEGDCGLSGARAETVLQLWEQARGALSATTLSEEGGQLDVRVVSVRGHVDAIHYHHDPPAGPYRRALYAEVDTASAHEAVVNRVFASTPAETLITAGYVRHRLDSSFVFDAPSAEMLLSDDFAAQHCFSIAGAAPDHPEWIGIAFTPRRTRDSLVDVSGVLWMDRATAELRRLTFEYTNLPGDKVSLCDPDPDPKLNLPGTGPHCITLPMNEQLELGGDADFLRLPSGEWLTVRWTVRTPPDAVKWRISGLKAHVVERRPETCYSGKDCDNVWIMWPRLVTRSGMITSVRRSGTEIYRSDGATTLMSAAAAKRVGTGSAGVAGIVTNADNEPLSNAIVQIEDPGRVGVTNKTGIFEIAMLPANRVLVTVRCRGYETARFPLPLLADSVRHLKLALPASANNASTDCSKTP